MKKLLSILLIAGLLFVCADAQAIMNRFNQDQHVQILTLTNPTTNNSPTFREYVSSTSKGILVAGTHRILGVMVMPCVNSGDVTGYETWAGIFDSTTVEQQDMTKLELEVETTVSGNNTMWLPYPYDIKEGVVVYLGPGATVSIFYETR